MKYIVKNCPALRWDKRHFKCCGEYPNYEKCENRNDCIMKQIVELCKEKIKVCEGCSKTADINIDCVECDEKGEANLARAIINLLEIEEVDK